MKHGEQDKTPYGVIGLILLLLAGAAWLSTHRYRTTVYDGTDAGVP